MSFKREPGVAFARSYLFAPGNSAKLLERVYGAGSDAVILDLEDAVPPQEKDRARTLVSQVIAERSSARPERSETHDRAGTPETFARVNGLESGRTRDDVMAVVGPSLRGIRLPKVESGDSVREVSSWLLQAEHSAGMPEGSIRLDPTIETARGVAAAIDIASADPRVGALVFGHADYCLDIGVEPGPDGLESLYARSFLVVASRAAGIAAPIDGAYTRLRDDEGLRQSAEAAKRLGYFGKSAIHPEQLAVIHEVFSPTAKEIEAARSVVAAFKVAEAGGVGAIRLEDGRFVDQAVVLRAHRTLALARWMSGDAEGR